MQYPIQIIFQRTDAVIESEAAVFEAIGRLESFCDHIVGCEVFIRGPEASDQNIYVVSLKVRTPDCEITVNGDRRAAPEHRELRRALDDAFSHAERELRSLSLPLCTCSGRATRLIA
jgi:hypothetical protein